MDLYENAPDPGLRAAAGWVLRRWGRRERLQQIDNTLATGRVEGHRGWYVNKQGQTFTLLDNPHRAGAGAGKEPMAQGFAIASTEVTVAQFRAFKADHKVDETVAPSPDCPVNSVSWYDAAAYCNWLSKQAGIAADQWCYLPGKDGRLDVAPDILRRAGYRLPTEQEWELACRAGAKTRWSCGEVDGGLASCYAQWYGNSQAMGVSQSCPVGKFKPNDFGLFDMHGNVSELCLDDSRRHETGRAFRNDITCSLRGGWCFSEFGEAGCDSRMISGRLNRMRGVGFRPARTFPYRTRPTGG
jgi:formylglycine-generating enzyme required for sulfatase activity